MTNCKLCQNELPELLLGGAPSASVRAHLAACTDCRKEYDSLLATFRLLDEWKAPAPSPFFDQRLQAHLREEVAAPRLGLVARLRDRVLYGSSLQLRPALAGALALLLIAGGGTFAGVHYTGSAPAPVAIAQPSAAINDLQLLDKNEQAIQQMDQLLNDDADAAPAQADPTI